MIWGIERNPCSSCWELEENSRARYLYLPSRKDLVSSWGSCSGQQILHLSAPQVCFLSWADWPQVPPFLELHASGDGREKDLEMGRGRGQGARLFYPRARSHIFWVCFTVHLHPLILLPPPSFHTCWSLISILLLKLCRNQLQEDAASDSKETGRLCVVCDKTARLPQTRGTWGSSGPDRDGPHVWWVWITLAASWKDLQVSLPLGDSVSLRTSQGSEDLWWASMYWGGGVHVKCILFFVCIFLNLSQI